MSKECKICKKEVLPLEAVEVYTVGCSHYDVIINQNICVGCGYVEEQKESRKPIHAMH